MAVVAPAPGHSAIRERSAHRNINAHGCCTPDMTPTTSDPAGRPRMMFSLALNTGGSASISSPCTPMVETHRLRQRARSKPLLRQIKPNGGRGTPYRLVEGNSAFQSGLHVGDDDHASLLEWRWNWHWHRNPTLGTANQQRHD
eukprot:scaffold1988_cov270-Prasinococcus_capsulatus_cf.AAC.12